jgi:hypothetical protein
MKAVTAIPARNCADGSSIAGAETLQRRMFRLQRRGGEVAGFQRSGAVLARLATRTGTNDRRCRACDGHACGLERTEQDQTRRCGAIHLSAMGFGWFKSPADSSL